MIEKVISGGQTGADQAGWRAAKACGIPCGGWMPPDFMTEAGPRMQFKTDFGAREIERDPSMIFPAGGTDYAEAYRVRTRLNVRDSDATFLFARDESSRGSRLTIRCCQDLGRPWLRIRPGVLNAGRIRMGADWLLEHRVRILNVAGHRESGMAGIGNWAETYLTEVFRLMSDPP